MVTAKAAKTLKKLISTEEDPFSPGNVISWTSRFKSSKGSKYTYAAIKASNGKWYVTGKGNSWGYTLTQLATTYMTVSERSDHKVSNIRIATEWAEVK